MIHLWTRYQRSKRWMQHGNINWRDVQKNVVNNADKFKGTMTKWPVHKPTHITTKHT